MLLSLLRLQGVLFCALAHWRTGHTSSDAEASAELCEHALRLSLVLLRPPGVLVMVTIPGPAACFEHAILLLLFLRVESVVTMCNVEQHTPQMLEI